MDIVNLFARKKAENPSLPGGKVVRGHLIPRLPLGEYLAALVVLVVLFVLAVMMTAAFDKVSPPAARLQAPYLVWLAFAAYLNAGFWLLNR